MAIERRHANPDYSIRGNGRYYPPYGDGGTSAEKGRRGEKHGYPNEMLWQFMEDIRYEPDWRREAEVDAAFYDGDQLKVETLERMKALGIPPIVVNMVAPIVDGITGFEALARSNLKCVPENEQSFEVAKAFNIKLKEATRMTGFDREVGRAFKSAVIVGVGWLEVSRESDPFKYPYRVKSVPWREMFADYKSREENYSDARYFIRRRWYDASVLKEHFPKKAKLIDAMMGGFQDSVFTEWESTGYTDIAQSLAQNLNQERRFTLDEDEWRNTERKRLAVYEILYSKPKQVEALRLPNGMTIELNEKSPAQLQAIASGQVKFVQGVTTQWRQALYMGPHQFSDRELELNMSHYIPFVAKRKNNDGSPYGPPRNMRSPQEGYNARHTRALYDLTSRKFTVDDDAVDDHEETSQELNKINSYVVLRGDRVGKGLDMLPTIDSTPVTMQLMMEAKSNLFDVTGIRPEFLGQIQSAGQSGVAIDQLIHQTQQVLGSLIDNYRESKHKAGQLIVGMIMNDMKDMENVEFESDEEPRKKIVLNARTASGERSNEIITSRMHVALGEVPASQTYMQQKLQSLAEIIKSMPPEIQPLFSDLIVKAYAPDEQEEILERIKSATGYGPEPKDPEKRQAQQEAMAQQQEMQQRAAAAEIALKEAEVKAKEADANERVARAEKLAEADTELTEAKTMVELAKAGDVETQSQIKQKETQIKGVEAAARLETQRKANQEKPKAAG